MIYPGISVLVHYFHTHVYDYYDKITDPYLLRLLAALSSTSIKSQISPCHTNCDILHRTTAERKDNTPQVRGHINDI